MWRLFYPKEWEAAKAKGLDGWKGTPAQYRAVANWITPSDALTTVSDFPLVRGESGYAGLGFGLGFVFWARDDRRVLMERADDGLGVAVSTPSTDHDPRSASNRARPSDEVQPLVPSALPTSLPSRPTTNTIGVDVAPYCSVTRPERSSAIVNDTGWIFSQAATCCGFSRVMATTARPRPLYSRCASSMVEGNSLVQCGHHEAQK